MYLSDVVDATGELRLGATDLPGILVEAVHLSSPPGVSPTVAEIVSLDISSTQPSLPASTEVVIPTTATAEERVPGQVSEELLLDGAHEESLLSGSESDVLPWLHSLSRFDETCIPLILFVPFVLTLLCWIPIQ